MHLILSEARSAQSKDEPCRNFRILDTLLHCIDHRERTSPEGTP
jgi:hypothetical protein